VKVKAISVNPVDVKVRASVRPEGNGYKIFGWDAAGVVKATGPECSLFKPGDEVFYAGVHFQSDRHRYPLPEAVGGAGPVFRLSACSVSDPSMMETSGKRSYRQVRFLA
jgi:NADPH:quinone reductase-like Zn-dependent oxidoreductase